MQTLASRARRRRLLPAVLVASLLLAAALATAGRASAAPLPVMAELRVEAGGKALAPGNALVTGTARVETFRSCGGSGNAVTVPGPTALGLLEFGEKIYPDARPVGISDEFDFGLFVCRIGDFTGSNTAFWLYKVNHKSPEVGGDQFTLKRGDHVLWFFHNPARGSNIGDELFLRTPPRVKPGQTFTATVFAFNTNGTPRRVAGATIGGEANATTDPQGEAEITPSESGFLTLRATRFGDIPSERVNVCVNSDLSKCAARRGERIFGTNGPNRIVGTLGRDVIISRGGNDRIDARGGGLDRIRCGAGFDFVRAGPRDLVAGTCNKVVRDG
jgi:hypothetical protein